MNLIEVKGGTKSQRRFVLAIVNWYIKKMLPRVRTLDITVRLTKCYTESNAMGYCLAMSDYKTFDIELDKNMRMFDTISTLCHELTHLKQFYRKEMIHKLHGKIQWKKKIYESDHPYLSQPWEKEAFEVEKQLAVEYFTEML
tara:strand:+ start:323 stop:748 length:426 start_codon:yes stop_codon:yes gene_type:complete